ncbi:hypothetical protein [Kribbella sp. NPDC051718]|uniref:hypothetical protein n=1 Tax=Kribbella sp. NPDC051718 TaxID=3155168 RepID=UPI00341B4E6E
MSKDIEDLLAAAADDADQPLRNSVDDIVQRGRRSVRHRRLAAIATAGLTAAVVVTGVAVWQGDRHEGFAPAEFGKTKPAPPVSPLADAEIIKRCGQNDKEWLESMTEQGANQEDKAGPINRRWTVPLKIGQGDVFLAFLVSPDQKVIGTCYMKGKTISTGESSYGREMMADQMDHPAAPTGPGGPSRENWTRVPPTVTRVVAVPPKGEPWEARVSNGFYAWGIPNPTRQQQVLVKIVGLDANGKVVFREQAAIAPG